MHVLPLSLGSPSAYLDDWHRLDRSIHDDVLAGIEPPTRGESLMELDSTIAENRWGLLATSDDRVVAGYVADESLLEDLDAAQGWLVVDPAHRRRGLATALLAAARERHLDGGRKRLESTTRVGSAGSAFAARAGARVVQIELCNVLDLEHVSPDLADLGAAVPEGYVVRTWQDTCPDDLLAEFAAAHHAMKDAPRGDVPHDDWTFTPERVRSTEARYQRAGVRAVTTAAVHEATGAVAGYTDVLVTGRRTTVLQEDTGVVRAHRGHGLGLLVKAVNLLRVLDIAPRTRTVMTWNAEANRHMLAVNHRLGFRPHSRWEHVLLDL